MSNSRHNCGKTFRQLRCEPLERREMLSVNVGNSPILQVPSSVDSQPAAIASQIDSSLDARSQALAISAVHLRIDGREVTLTSLDQLLEMNVGSSLQVVGIDYRLHGEESVTGKIAFEGYLNKLRGSRLRTDYGEGRFGGHEQQGELPFGRVSHSGLDGDWTMQAGTESLTIVMVRYGADEVVVEDRITIRTQVGTPDFVFNPELKIKGSNKGLVAGRTVKISGSWGNLGEGTYRNYAEVDIYHESDPSKIVWSGSIADLVEAGEVDKGTFVNKVKRDGFSRHWIPELGGTYTLKFYADPENLWNEANETNNVYTTQIEVQDLRYRPRTRDAFHGYGFNHHNVVDDQPALAAVAASSANSIGTDSHAANPLVSDSHSNNEPARISTDASFFAALGTQPEVKVDSQSNVTKQASARSDDNHDGETHLEAIDLAFASALL